MKKTLIFCVCIFAALSLSACGKVKPSGTCGLTGSQACTGKVDHSDITKVSKEVLSAFKNKDLQSLATFVGPQGVRFSPYSYVRTGNDVVLLTNAILELTTTDLKTVRGTQDGSGLPITMNFRDYISGYVYDVDFLTAPEVLINQKSDRGNTINNAFDVYAGKYLIEYYFSGFEPKYEGMDWKSLMLVFDKKDGQRYLIGVIHGQRTI